MIFEQKIKYSWHLWLKWQSSFISDWKNSIYVTLVTVMSATKGQGTTSDKSVFWLIPLITLTHWSSPMLPWPDLRTPLKLIFWNLTLRKVYISFKYILSSSVTFFLLCASMSTMSVICAFLALFKICTVSCILLYYSLMYCSSLYYASFPPCLLRLS